MFNTLKKVIVWFLILIFLVAAINFGGFGLPNSSNTGQVLGTKVHKSPGFGPLLEKQN